MKQGQDIAAKFPGVLIVHQKIRGSSLKEHEHSAHEVFLPLQGDIQIHVKDHLLKAGPGKMIYLPPKVKHAFQASQTSQGERLIFILEDKIWKANKSGCFPPSVISISQLCKELLFHLLIHPKTKASMPLIETLVQTISEMLETAQMQAHEGLSHLDGISSDPRLKRALSEIQSKFNAPLSMTEIAKTSGMSVRNLNRLFLTELGMTPKQIITLHRMEHAKNLLRQGQSVTDAAFESGYSSLSQFITTFRKLTGQLPSEI